MSRAEGDTHLLELFDLTGRTALVTGGAGHLGSALAKGLAEAGARVAVTSRTLERAQIAASRLPDPGDVGHVGMVLDHLAEETTLRESFQAIVEAAGPVDVLVNNGHEHCRHDWTDMTGKEFSRQLENATGYFLLARLVWEHAVERGAGASVILLGSMYGLVGSYPEIYEGIAPVSPAAYHALKGGVIQLTRHLAVCWAKDGVRVNCLSPGPFPGPSAPVELIPQLEGRSPMGRVGRPAELKGAVVFLASDASSYVTGQNLVIDGGWTAW